MTWTADEELMSRVRHSAERCGLGPNEYVARVMRAATDRYPESAEATEVRARPARAGLLDVSVEGRG